MKSASQMKLNPSVIHTKSDLVKKKQPLSEWTKVVSLLVETAGLEPVTPCMSSKYSNQLS